MKKKIIQLKTIARRNQQKQLPLTAQRLCNFIRQMIETVDGQLSNQLKTLKSIMRSPLNQTRGAYVGHPYQSFPRQA